MSYHGKILQLFGGNRFTNLYASRLDAVNEALYRSGFSLNTLSAFTVAIHAKSSSAVTNNYMFSCPDTAGGNGCDLRWGALSTLSGTVKTATGSASLNSGLTYNDGVYRTFMLWYDGVDARIYVNNTQVASVARTGAVDNSINEFNINRFSSSFNLCLGADYDEISVWSIALDSTGRGILDTPTNLLLHPNYSTANLMAWYRCGDDPLDDLTATTGTIRDQSGNGRHLTPINTEVTDKVSI